jgi:uncharacterized protein YndB with AHSA1/START domain
MNVASKSPADSSTDRIEKTIVLHAPRSKVWRALTDSKRFGEWFRAKIEVPFVAGQRAYGGVTYPGYEHLRFEVVVEQMEPERLFSWRWQPGGNPDLDPAEPTTLVVFVLEEVPEGTRVTVTETGFDRIPAERRGEAYRQNEAGWTGQLKNLQEHLAGQA